MPSITGTANRNIIVVPCSGEDLVVAVRAEERVVRRCASCSRISSASMPPSSRKMNAVTM